MPFFAWLTNNPLAQKLALIGAAILAFILGEKIWRSNIEKGVRRQERDARERAVLVQKAEVAETRREMAQETHDARAQADAAVAGMPKYPSIGSLRNDNPDVFAGVWPDAAAGGGPPEGR